MNYQHSFHAGNFADVMKHIVFVYTINHFKKKESPFFVLDTHAGAGVYDLKSEAALKTQEACYGVLKLRGTKAPTPLLEMYLKAVEPFLLKGLYPGSPQLAADSLRYQDILRLTELHPLVFSKLKESVAGACAIHPQLQSGYEALKAYLPPKERRGIVLIDPPFEQEDEFEQLTTHVINAYKRFSHGTFIIWYPIKNKAHASVFKNHLRDLPVEQMDVSIHLDNPLLRDKLNRAGLYILNPPYLLKESLEELAPVLESLLHAEISIESNS